MENKQRLLVLDGWRGISILVVLACHLLPLGPKAWQINEAAAPLGMALFFTLSGFLITSFLMAKPEIDVFLVRRVARILPLSSVCLTVALIWQGAEFEVWANNLLFVSNWPPMTLPIYLPPFWSLCVEFQFYVGIALLVLFFKERAFWLIPIVCLLVTLFRIYNGAHVAINTYFRVDEILAGACLALIYHGKSNLWLVRILNRDCFFPVFLIFLISCHPASESVNYIRPYAAALLIGTTLYNPGGLVKQVLSNKYVVYMAAVSYSLYLIHPLLVHSWLGEGDALERYLKRPLLFGVLFFLAHVSTFYFERYFINLSHKFGSR